jgi:ATP-binding cassette subfamily B multidrug efflux pump
MKKLFTYFETLVDPYTSYPNEDVPPKTLWRFMLGYTRPFNTVFWAAGILSIVVAAIEIALIYYTGWLVDVLTGAPADVWAAHGSFLIGLALFVLLIRPAIQFLDVLLLNNTILPNLGTLVRWRAHNHVLRQSVGWFENDFAGRIANRIMQTPPAAGEAVFQVFDALTYSVAYIVGAAVLLYGADMRLMLPLAVWLIGYGLLMQWTLKRVGPASQKASDARSAVTGRVVDSYTNIHSVKMFAHHDGGINFAREAIEEARRTFIEEMRIYSVMDFVLTLLNGVLIVGVVGWAIYLWM